ncbi:MAG TPA: hypothetical protein VMV10_25335 [Pirellulales bacterium]|nr:hypothetical protein [Pirellulales bacterium]
MADAFDPYHRWLGIPPGVRPPTHYQLLAISPEEQDRAVINAAVTRQSVYVRNFQVGKHGSDAARILGEIQSAKLCLLDPSSRAEYDARLVREAGAKSTRQAPPVAHSVGLGLDLDAVAGNFAAPVARGRASAPRLRTLSKPKRSVSWVGPAAVAAACIAALFVGYSVRGRGGVSVTDTSPTEPRAIAEASSPPQSDFGSIANSPSPESTVKLSNSNPVANSPSPELTSSSPGPEPTVELPNPKPVASSPSPEPAASSPSPEPAASSPSPEPTADLPSSAPAADAPNVRPTEGTDGESDPSDTPLQTEARDSAKQQEFPDLTRKLNDLASWTVLRGQWSKRTGGIHGQGDSVVKFNEECPAEFLLTFRMNVLEGMRPRIYFDEQAFWFGNEGFERTLFVYGDGQQDGVGKSRAYANRAALKIACRFAGQDVEFMVNGKPVAHCRRKKTGAVVLGLSAGDGFSPGKVLFSNFKLDPLSEPGENVSSAVQGDAGSRARRLETRGSRTGGSRHSAGVR